MSRFFQTSWILLPCSETSGLTDSLRAGLAIASSPILRVAKLGFGPDALISHVLYTLLECEVGITANLAVMISA